MQQAVGRGRPPAGGSPRARPGERPHRIDGWKAGRAGRGRWRRRRRPRACAGGVGPGGRRDRAAGRTGGASSPPRPTILDPDRTGGWGKSDGGIPTCSKFEDRGRLSSPVGRPRRRNALRRGSPPGAGRAAGATAFRGRPGGRQPLLRAADGGLGRRRRRPADRTDVPALAAFRGRRGQAHLGRRGRGRARTAGPRRTNCC